MQLGETEEPVYYHSNDHKRVIKIGEIPGAIGFLQDIDTKEVFPSWRSSSLQVIGKARLKAEVIEIKE